MPVLVRVPSSGYFWKDVCGGGCGLAMTISGAYFFFFIWEFEGINFFIFLFNLCCFSLSFHICACPFSLNSKSCNFHRRHRRHCQWQHLHHFETNTTMFLFPATSKEPLTTTSFQILREIYWFEEWKNYKQHHNDTSTTIDNDTSTAANNSTSIASNPLPPKNHHHQQAHKKMHIH